MSDADGAMARLALGAFMLIWETVHTATNTAVLIVGAVLVGAESIGYTVRAIVRRNGAPPPH